jgi:hypothetical protein
VQKPTDAKMRQDLLTVTEFWSITCAFLSSSSYFFLLSFFFYAIFYFCFSFLFPPL